MKTVVRACICILCMLSLSSEVSRAAESGTRPVPSIAGEGAKFLFKQQDGSYSTLLVLVSPTSKTADTAALLYFAGGHDSMSLEVQDGSDPVPSHLGSRRAVPFQSLFTPLENADELPRAVLEDAAGLPLARLILAQDPQLDKYRIGENTILVPAGQMPCVQYRISAGDHTIDFWLSDRAAPLRLVQLNSSGPEPDQNFELILLSFVKNRG